MGKLAEAVVLYQRDFYLRSGAEMRRMWKEDKSAAATYSHFAQFLPAEMTAAHKENYGAHNPLWEYIRAFQYFRLAPEDDPLKYEFDIETQRQVPLDEYYLYEPLHRAEICNRFHRYLTEPQPPHKRGLAVFILREGLKSRMLVGTASWLLTRHRVLYHDFTGIRIIHDVEDMAIERAGWIHDLHTYCKPLRALYPEVALPTDVKWGTQKGWSLPGCEGRGIEEQIAASGARSVRQGSHYPYTLLDDLEGDRHIASPASRAETERLFEMLKYSGKGTQSKTILVGTFYSPFSVHATVDALGRPEDADGKPREPTWDVIRLPGILDEGMESERAIYPTRRPLEHLKAMSQAEIDATGDDLNFRMQIMLDFKAAGKYEFDLTRWQTFSLDEPEEEAEEIVAALEGAPLYIQYDAAGKDETTREKGDWNAILAVAYPRIAGRVHVVVVDGLHDRSFTLDEGSAAALDLAHNWNAWAIVAEESPSHKLVGQTLDRLSKERGLRYYQRLGPAGKPAGNIISLVPRAVGGVAVGNISRWKMARMRKTRGKWNAGLVWLASHLDWLPDLKDCLVTFPFCKNDDILDALSLSEDERIAERMPESRIHTPTPLADRRRLLRARDTRAVTRYTGLVYRGR